MHDITRTCVQCKRTRDTDLFTGAADTCDLCINKPASIEAKKARTAARIAANTARVARARNRLSEAEKYRGQLERSGAGYTDAQIAAYVAARFPSEAA